MVVSVRVAPLEEKRGTPETLAKSVVTLEPSDTSCHAPIAPPLKVSVA